MSATLNCSRCGEKFEAKRSDALYCPKCKKIRRLETFRDYENREQIPCPKCGKPTGRRSKLCLSCDNKRRVEDHEGHNNPNWREGRTRNCGYVLIRTGKTPGAGAYTPEHRLVWEKAHGKLPKGWIVHHLNGERDDNRLENLLAMPRNRHSHKYLTEPYQKRIKQLEQLVADLQSRLSE